MNLTAYLKANRAEHEFIEKATTHHASDASRTSGIPLDRIAKTIVFQGDSGSLAVGVVLGTQMVSRHKLEQRAGLRKLQVATDSVAENATGFPTGGIPPVGHRKRLKVYVDHRVAELDQIWCGGGTRTRLVRLDVADILRLSAAEVCDIAVADA
jgi:Cys-tRNA(Pro) deacylase